MVGQESTHIDFAINTLHLNSSGKDRLAHYFENWWCQTHGYTLLTSCGCINLNTFKMGFAIDSMSEMTSQNPHYSSVLPLSVQVSSTGRPVKKRGHLKIHHHLFWSQPAIFPSVGFLRKQKMCSCLFPSHCVTKQPDWDGWKLKFALLSETVALEHTEKTMADDHHACIICSLQWIFKIFTDLQIK